MAEVALGLGSNLGDRAGAIISALRALCAVPGVRLLAVSSLYRSEPWGLTHQPEFLNMAALIETDLSPLETLRMVKALEISAGRQTRERWGPREIDIDVLFHDASELVSEELVLPHPGLFERRFVLAPLAEILPDRLIQGRTPGQGLVDLGAVSHDGVERDEVESRRLADAFPFPSPC
jgi:2-amino-4-hydroxy-6-hydroxymethyldihydropteridine diphosphokinase